MTDDARVSVRGVIRLAALLVLAWPVMTITHEVGHLIGGWLGGATLVDVQLMPWQLPYSVFHPDPHPRLTLWSGPLFGALAPLVVAAILRRPAVWWVAWFCMLSGGVYLAIGAFAGGRELDTPRLLHHGASPWSIVAFSLLTIGWSYPRFRDACIACLRDQDDSTDSEDHTSRSSLDGDESLPTGRLLR